ncbi:MAG: putative metal-binding motif-containing protein [Myxococcota bacterium]|nr:putative metal-binding motif-containing protein [Myxococcota bacterium]
MLLFALWSCTVGSDTKLGIYNQPPAVSIVSPVSGSEYDEGEVVEFSAVIGDDFTAPGDLGITWQSDLQGELVGGDLPTDEGQLLWSTANLLPGEHIITLVVFDEENEATQDTTQISITDLPDIPEIRIVQPISGDYGIEDEYYTFIVEVYDGFDPLNELIVTFSNQNEVFCQPVPDSTGRAACDAILDAGDHDLLFTVSNSNGFTAEAQGFFVVRSTLDIDNDGDNYTENQGDCDDTNSTVYPGAEEVENGYDDDCNGLIDEGDDDGDGYNEEQLDCNDNDPTVNPGAVEVANGIDDNCNGLIDENTENYDDDGDGYCESGNCVNTTNSAQDCNDADILVSPSETEICGDGIDNNCNNDQNELNAVNCTEYYRDYDGDNYGDPNYSTECWCSPVGDFDVTNNLDCYDYNSLANPNQSGYFSTHRGDFSFDYNCQDGEELLYTTTGTCYKDLGLSEYCRVDTVGWSGATPSCGQSGDILDDDGDCECSSNWTCLWNDCVFEPDSSLVQECR